METLKTKERIRLELDACGMRGRFTIRDVAEQVLPSLDLNKLSLSDQRDAAMLFLSREIRAQMKAPLRDEVKDVYLKRLPQDCWPVIDGLTKTICVSSGGAGAYHVLTWNATRQDWEDNLLMADVMAKRARTAKHTAREIRDLLEARGAMTLKELMTGEKPRLLAVTGR